MPKTKRKSKTTNNNSEEIGITRATNFFQMPVIKYKNIYYVASTDFRYFIYSSQGYFNNFSPYIKNKIKFEKDILMKLIPLVKKWTKEDVNAITEPKQYGIFRGVGVGKGVILFPYDDFTAVLRRKFTERMEYDYNYQIHLCLDHFKHIFDFDTEWTPSKHAVVFDLDDNQLVIQYTITNQPVRNNASSSSSNNNTVNINNNNQLNNQSIEESAIYKTLLQSMEMDMNNYRENEKVKDETYNPSCLEKIIDNFYIICKYFITADNLSVKERANLLMTLFGNLQFIESKSGLGEKSKIKVEEMINICLSELITTVVYLQFIQICINQLQRK
ncbi:hypothetical protein ABK040_009357 [Willaertia magna]